MSDEKFHSFLHCKYLTQYHKICYDYNYHIKALEVMPDHIHIFVDVPQTVASYAMLLELLKVSVLSKYLKHTHSLKSSMQDVELYGQECILSQL